MPSTALIAAQQDNERRMRVYWEDEKKKCGTKIALLVEGDDDKFVLEALLTRRKRTWANAVHVVAAGGKGRVLARMRDDFPDGFGVVDKDFWTDAEATTAAAGLGGRLYVTAGWCLENSLFTEPGTALDAGTDKEFGHLREEWVRAGALWWSLQRARDAFNGWQDALDWTYGRPRPDLLTGSRDELGASLQARISAEVWASSKVELAAVLDRYEVRLAEVQALTPAEQWLVGVHGKHFYADRVVPHLNATPPQRNATGWLAHLARSLHDIPGPLDGLIGSILV